MDVFSLLASITLDKTEYEQGLSAASKSTSDFGGKLKKGLSTAAKSGAVAIGAVASAATAMTAALIKGVSATAEYGDNIDKMSQKMGMSAEAYQEWDAVMQHSGTTMESLQTGMKTLANAVESGNDAFDRLGISQEEIASMNNEELFSATITALQNVENETERTYLAGQLLGRGATELGALLNTSAEDTQAMKDRVHELGGVMSNEAVKASAKYQDSLQDMKTAFSSIGRGLTSEFMPSITMVMDGLTEVFSGNSESGIGMITQGITDFVENLEEVIPRIMEIGGSIVSALAGAIIDSIPQIVDVGTEIIMQIAMSIVEHMPQIAEAAVSIVSTLVLKIGENLPMILTAAVETISALAKGLADSLPDLIPTIVNIVVTIVESLIENAGQLLDASIEIILALADGIIDSLPYLIEKAPEIIAKLIEAVIEAVPKLLRASVEIVKKLASGIVENFPKLLEVAKKIPGIIVNGIKSLISSVVDVGKDIVSGVWEGIKGMGKWLGEKVSGFFGGIVNGIKGFLGIHSPSKVFAGIGENMALGLGKGWDNSYGDIKKQIERGMDFGVATAGINAYSEWAGGYGVASAQQALGPISITINGARYSDEESLAEAISVKLQDLALRRSAVFG